MGIIYLVWLWSCLANFENLVLHRPRCFQGLPVQRQQADVCPRCGSGSVTVQGFCDAINQSECARLPGYLEVSFSCKRPRLGDLLILPNMCWETGLLETWWCSYLTLGQVIGLSRWQRTDPQQNWELGASYHGMGELEEDNKKIPRTTGIGVY